MKETSNTSTKLLHCLKKNSRRRGAVRKEKYIVHLNSLQHGEKWCQLYSSLRDGHVAKHQCAKPSPMVHHGGIITGCLGNMTAEGSYELYLCYITYFGLCSISQKGKCCSGWRMLFVGCYPNPLPHVHPLSPPYEEI